MRRRFLLLIALVGLVTPTPAAAFVRGIDVSHWKGWVNWPRVAQGGYRFTFAEATNGFGRDWTYGRNRTGASAARIAFGAFHLARPNGATLSAVVADAVSEARFFAAAARPRTGDLTPVLDLERTGGLAPPALRIWVTAWLDEVERRIGARPTIYASPAFWSRALRDSSVFAATGSQLWVAHWHVRAPRVPAGNWAAGGWTFWQWTNCSRVPGIRGCVDGDCFRGDSLESALLAAPPVLVTPPLVLGSPQTGQQLSATGGTWQADPAPSLAYRWRRCDPATGRSCTLIAGAMTSSYTVTANDVGFALEVVVTATSRRRSASAESLPVAVTSR